MNTNNIYVALDNVRSLHNVGAIMRTCSFFGIKNLILIGYSGTTYDFKGQTALHPELKKTSLGSEDDLSILMFPSPNDLIDFAKKNATPIIAIEQSLESTNIYEWSPREKMIIVFGNETGGVSKDILDATDLVVEIKKYGNKNSLNVAVTAGIIISYIKQKD